MFPLTYMLIWLPGLRHMIRDTTSSSFVLQTYAHTHTQTHVYETHTIPPQESIITRRALARTHGDPLCA